MANGSTGQLSLLGFSASNQTQAEGRMARRIKASEKSTYDYLTSHGMSDKEAREELYKMRQVRDVPF